MDKIRVLLIVNRLNTGGITSHIALLAKYISNDFEIRVISGEIGNEEGKSEELLDGLKYTVIPNMGRSVSISKDIKALFYVRKYIKKFNPDIIHTHGSKAGVFGRLAAVLLKKNIRVFHTYHGNVFGGYFSKIASKFIVFFERFLGRFTDGILTLSSSQRSEIIHKYKIVKEDKVHIIPLGLHLEKFQTNRYEKRVQFRQEFNLKNSSVVISIIGRLVPIKNHKFFLDIIAKCKNEAKDLKGFIVGDGELRDELKRHCVRKGLKYNIKGEIKGDEDIIFTSWRNDIDNIVLGSEIVALTSLNEGTPVSIIEAMAAGKSVISTDVGGVRDIIDNGKTGYISTQDINEYSEMLLNLIRDKEMRERMETNGEKKVTSLFSHTRLLKDIEKLYHQEVKLK